MNDADIIKHYGGTVSHGTMRAVDLLDVLPDVIATIDSSRRDALDEEYGDWFALHRLVTNGYAGATDKGNEQLDALVRECFDVLDDLAPEGYRFGAHEGDGSDYGFWPTECECGHESGDYPCEIGAAGEGCGS